MQRSEQVDTLIAAFSKAQAAMVNPSFDSTNPHFKNRYASLAAVRDAVIPALTANGLALTQCIETQDEQVICETTLWHTSGQWLSTILALPASKPDAQGYGSASTYARRYALQALCCVAGDEDDDAEMGKHSSTATATVTTPAMATTTHRTDKSPELGNLNNQIHDLLVAQNLDEEAIEKYWRHLEHKYGVYWSAGNARKVLGELQVAAQKKTATTATAPTSATATATTPKGQAWMKNESPQPASPSMWRDTLKAHLGTLEAMRGTDVDDGSIIDLTDQCWEALGKQTFSDTAGLTLAGKVLDWLEKQAEVPR